jgi:hypothetical protein
LTTKEARADWRDTERDFNAEVFTREVILFLCAEREREYMLSLCFLKKERNRKKRPPQPCQPKKKITQDSLFLVDFEPTTMKKKNSSPPLSCDDF